MYFIDVQGTLIDDHTKLPIRGAVEFIDHLNSSKIPYMVITNSTKNPSVEFLAYLNSIGLNIPQRHYLDPLMVLEEHIAKNETIAAYGSDEFLNVLKSMGYALDFASPDVVLIAIKENFTSDEYAQMIEFILGGAKLIGMHETSLYAKNHKRYPGVGAILKMVEFATQRSYTVVGKPSRAFFKASLEGLNQQGVHHSFSDVTIISDDVTGDILPAQELGMKGVFVLSGKYRVAEEIIPNLKVQPDAIYADMQAVLESL
ncbi:MAG: HAD-IIA family hydrolase [Sulfuricurvum sp.]|uniref:HAD-IIA family hydrolase n=1 Tax=Sulfuricurvum sp. TaxID=2025608 RepID=UPI00261FD42E|nr:HAD-IIA family hydrolase [Sulfuricurvum sp.]MDD2829750.1 HAD-IIA family hydrolase [Sulfuricurvum sp.]MDD4948498.1 HAD-IIA family hydrolase [Sulfuricurvum sp.]